MSPKPETATTQDFPGLEAELQDQLQTFETFFKSFGFKRIHGRVWGLLVLAGQGLSSKEVVAELGISQGAASTTLNELAEWGAVESTFDPTRRCHLHAAVGNTLSIVATVLRRREQVAFARFREGMTRTLDYIRETHGARDPRVLTLRSILSTCEIAEAVMQLVFSSVSNALGDPQSLLSRAVGTALKIGIGKPGKALGEALTESRQIGPSSLEPAATPQLSPQHNHPEPHAQTADESLHG